MKKTSEERIQERKSWTVKGLALWVLKHASEATAAERELAEDWLNNQAFRDECKAPQKRLVGAWI